MGRTAFTEVKVKRQGYSKRYCEGTGIRKKKKVKGMKQEKRNKERWAIEEN